MGRPKTPQQKKREAYSHDRVQSPGCPHGTRRNRPEVKALNHRQKRRAVNRAVESEPEQDAIEREIGTSHWRDTDPLRERVQLKLNGRVQREAHNIFRSGYGEENHAKFRRVLTTWMLGRSRHLVGLARFYRSFFEEELPIRARFMDVRRNFLTQFFAKEPALGRKFQRWIQQMAQGD
jgi:hypothetical protein